MTPLNFRKEKDSLGELQVPASAYYGAQTQRAVDNFPISGLQPWRAFIWSIVAVKRAAALVNFELGLFNDRNDNNPARNIGEIQETAGQPFTAKQLAESIAQAQGSNGWQWKPVVLIPFRQARGRVII
jgi:fumarate hydratase class II